MAAYSYEIDALLNYNALSYYKGGELMVKVCAHYCGTTILLEEFETVAEAEEFMKHDYVMLYADEIESGEDEYIYADEMFLDDEDIPFCEPLTLDEIKDDLPF